ncbi:hypothetical protein D9M72_348700 [compost metagenome]
MENMWKEFSRVKANKKKHQFPCKTCGREQVHLVVAQYNENGGVDCRYGSASWLTENQIIQCQGCETVSFRVTESSSEAMDYDEFNRPYYPKTEKFYPARIIGVASMNEIDLLSMPGNIYKIYSETVQAIESGQNILAGIGIRALVEIVCEEKKIKGRSLYVKIQGLQDAGVVTEEGAKMLHHLRSLGNKAAHEVKAHSTEQLKTAIEVVGYMLLGTYTLPKKVEQAFTEKEEDNFPFGKQPTS